MKGKSEVTSSLSRETVLKALMANMYRRAVMAFPDEDVDSEYKEV